jgi:hypothetical protein
MIGTDFNGPGRWNGRYRTWRRISDPGTRFRPVLVNESFSPAGRRNRLKSLKGTSTGCLFQSKNRDTADGER